MIVITNEINVRLFQKLEEEKARSQEKEKRFSFSKKFIGCCSAIIMMIFPIISSYIFKSHQMIQFNFNQLATDVRNLSYADEFLYTDLKIKPANHTNIRNDINLLRSRLQILLDQHESLGRLVSPRTYCAIHRFSSWNNTLQSASNNITKIHLKSPAAMSLWRNKILTQIYSNEVQRKGAESSLIEYFSKLKEEKYTAQERC